MTVWAKLQSWLGASASDVAIDNEFNNIYLGLNEAANGNLPSGYNKAELSFTAASLTIKGETKMGNTNVLLDSALTVSGLAGWRYIVTTNGGVMSVESIPPAEITADTLVYTPTPVFNTSNNGYYSTVNTVRRIVGICYFDGANILKSIAYGNGKIKNDTLWISVLTGGGVNSTTNGRLEYVGSFGYANGDGLSIINYGAGISDNEGVRVTSNRQGNLEINITLNTYLSGISYIEIACHKNGELFQYCTGESVSQGTDITNKYISVVITDNAQKDDKYTFYISSISGVAQAAIYQMTAKLVE